MLLLLPGLCHTEKEEETTHQMGSEEGRMEVRPVLVLEPASLRILPAGVMCSTA